MTLAPAPRPRSPAQIEAARRNGARSNGPVTAEGKARASRNALRHGLCSPAILFPGEDPAHFEALRAALEAEYAPASPSARLLVERLAVTVWKLARCDRLEARLAAIEPHCPTGRLFPDPGLPRVLSRIPELATLLRWQAQLDRQLHRLTNSLAERARCASPSGEPAAAGDGPAAEGEPDPPATAPPEASLRPAAAAPARDSEEAVEHDGAAGLANPSNEAEPGPLRVDQGAAVEPALSATDRGVAATAPPTIPNEPEPMVIGPGGRAAATRAGSARHASPNLPNEPEPGAPLDRARPGSGAECAGAADRGRHRAAVRLPDAAPPAPCPEALLARGDLAGYLRARTAPSPRHPPSTGSSPGPRLPDPPPHHPPPRGKPDP